MKKTVYRRFFVPSLLVACSIFSGGLAGMAEDLDGPGGGCARGGPAGAFMTPPQGGQMFAQGGPGMGLQAPFGGPMGFGMLPPPLHPMAAPGMIPPPPPGMGLMVLPLGELDLSDDQTEKLAALKADAMDKAGPAMLKVHALERQFRSALVQPEISRDQLARVQGQLAAQKQALDAIFSDNLVASAQVLTPEQRQVLRQKMNHDELGPFTFRKKGPAVEHK